MRPSLLRRLRSASPTADLSTSPTKRKTDDCTPLRGRPPSVHSIPYRHQTCRAEGFTSAHFPDKSAQSAAYSRHLRNIIQPLLCDCPSGLPPGRGSAHTAHNPDYVKYLPPPPSRKWTRTEPLYLRTRVSTFSKERAECRQAATLYDGFQPVPAVSPAKPATLSIQEPSAEAPGSSQHHQHPTSPALPEKPSPSRSESVPERRAELPILIRDCTRQPVSRLSFGPAV